MDTDPGSIILKIVTLFALIFVNAFFSMSEMAIVTLNDNKIDKMAEQGNKKAKQIKKLTDMGFEKCPVCVAKTQYSFSDDPTKLGAPENFTVTVRNVKISAGAGFIVVLTGDIMTMPGLPKVPAAERIDVDEDGKITGLF